MLYDVRSPAARSPCITIAHDVFVLQVHGSKHWFIYDQPEAAPIGKHVKS